MLYEDSAGTQAILTSILHIVAPCVTTGLQGVNSSILSTTYTIGEPTKAVDLGTITNGNCHFDIENMNDLILPYPETMSTLGL